MKKTFSTLIVFAVSAALVCGTIILAPGQWEAWEAVDEITDQAALVEIVKNDADKWKRWRAVSKIDDQSIIAKIATRDADWEVRQAAVPRLEDKEVVAGIAANDKSVEVRKSAVHLLEDLGILMDLARNDKDWQVRSAAIHELSRPLFRAQALMPLQSMFIEIINDDNNRDVRLSAINGIDFQMITVHHIDDCTNSNDRLTAVKTIYDGLFAIEEFLRTDEPPEAELYPIEFDYSTYLTERAQAWAGFRHNVDVYFMEHLLVEEDEQVRKAIVEGLTIQEALMYIAKNEEIKPVRQAAEKRLNDLKKQGDNTSNNSDREMPVPEATTRGWLWWFALPVAVVLLFLFYQRKNIRHK